MVNTHASADERVAHPIDVSPLHPPMAWRILVKGVHLLMTKIFRWKVSVRVEGDPVPPGQAVVVAVNHTGYMEPFLATYQVWRETGHWHRPLAKAALFKVPVLGFLGWRSGGISVQRESKAGRAGAYAAAIEALDDGHAVYVAPEGTLTHDGELLPLRHGAARLALQAGCPMMVVTHFGGQRAWSRIVGFPHFGAHFDLVIDTVVPTEDDDEETLTGRIAAIMLDRSMELRAEYAQQDTEATWWPPYTKDVEPSAQGRENLERYRESMVDAVANARQRMTAAAAERDIDLDEAVQTARERARRAVVNARARAEELVELARNGELGDELRHRAEELRVQASEIAEHVARLRDEVTGRATEQPAATPAPDEASTDVADEPTQDTASGDTAA